MHDTRVQLRVKYIKMISIVFGCHALMLEVDFELNNISSPIHVHVQQIHLCPVSLLVDSFSPIQMETYDTSNFMSVRCHCDMKVKGELYNM